MVMQRYVRCVLIMVACLLGFVATFNYQMDPGNIFGRSRLAETLGSWLLTGHKVAVVQNYDERLVQNYLIVHDSRSYDVLVLGSSRSMGIGQELFPNAVMKNYSVSGASLEDDVALYFLYERLHGKPRKIVLCADAWLLNRNNGQNRWKSLVEEYAYGKKRMTGQSIQASGDDLDKYKQLLSWAYFRASMEEWKTNRDGICLVDEKNAVLSNAGVVYPDGSHISSANEQAKDAESEARKYISDNVYSLENFDVLNEELRTELQTFLCYLKAQGVEVVLYLTPYHPIVYTYFVRTEKYWQVMAAEQYFKKCAEENGFSVVGSYNPGACGLSNADFLDGMHLRREAVYRILEGKL